MASRDEATAPKLGILAGGGSAPGSLIEACQKLKRDFFVICLEGQADPNFAASVPHAWVPLGGALKLKALVQEQKIGEMVMIGHVRRPSLLELKPDFLALKFLTKIGFSFLGDDALLRGIGKGLEEETGVKMIGAHKVFGGLLTAEGVLGRIVPDAMAQQDIERGLHVVKLLGQADVGQSVVVQQGLVLGLEAAEGTDAMILRTSALRREGPGGVLIKMAKPQQDNRFDLPAIGPATIATVIKAGLRGIAVEAERSLFLDRERAIAAADEAGVFVVGIKTHA